VSTWSNGDVENTLFTPLQFAFVVAFGATILCGAAVRFLCAKVRPAHVARKYALLLTTGFSYGRFMGIEAIADPAIAGSTAGAAASLALLWYGWFVHPRRTTGLTERAGS
jgi:hypothetical protein